MARTTTSSSETALSTIGKLFRVNNCRRYCSAAAGSRRLRFQQILASSKSIRAGAASSTPSRASMIRARSGSAKQMAAIADASTTLTVTIFADHVYRRRRNWPDAFRKLSNLPHRHDANGQVCPCSLLQDRHELALKRTMVSHGPVTQYRDNVVGRILYRQGDWHRRLHIGSDLEPIAPSTPLQRRATGWPCCPRRSAVREIRHRRLSWHEPRA